LVRKAETDRWHFVALGSGIGAMLLFWLFLYAPNGMWKLAVAILLAVALVVMMWNPRYRLFALGTAAAITGIAGFVTELSLNVTATLPGGGILSAGVEGGTDVSPAYFIALFGLGITTVAFDNVGRGWLWSLVHTNDTARPDLSFVLHDSAVKLTERLAENGDRRFHLSLSASKAEGVAVSLVRIEIKDAEILEWGVGKGDGVQNSMRIEHNSGSELSILGTIPESKISRGSAIKREIAIVDEFDRSWSVGPVTFQLSP
tara:strand:- start:1143 stop:1919 length:777 start_codon:yes stop_codon:yes gene_type:complete